MSAMKPHEFHSARDTGWIRIHHQEFFGGQDILKGQRV